MSAATISAPTNMCDLDCFIICDLPTFILEISRMAITNSRIPRMTEPSLISIVAPRKSAKMSRNMMMFLQSGMFTATIGLDG